MPPAGAGLCRNLIACVSLCLLSWYALGYARCSEFRGPVPEKVLDARDARPARRLQTPQGLKTKSVRFWVQAVASEFGENIVANWEKHKGDTILIGLRPSPTEADLA